MTRELKDPTPAEQLPRVIKEGPLHVIKEQALAGGEPNYPLGYLAAKRVVEAGRAAFFRSPSFDLPVRTSTILAEDDCVPQFGYVGTDFHALRVLLLGINPGDGAKDANARSAGDEQMMPALHRFAKFPSPQSFLAAQNAYKGVCRSWHVWGRHCDELLKKAGLSIDQIAYSNCLPWRTASKSAFGDSIAERASRLYAIPLIEELKPRIIVAVGKKAGTILGYATNIMPPMVVWNRAQALTESVEKDRQAATARFCALLEEIRRDNAT